jgi:hypothetical protein
LEQLSSTVLLLLVSIVLNFCFYIEQLSLHSFFLLRITWLYNVHRTGCKLIHFSLFFSGGDARHAALFLSRPSATAAAAGAAEPPPGGC